MKKISIVLTILIILCIFVGCSDSAEKKIVLAGKTYTESQLIAEVMAQLIENNTDIKVERKYDMSGAICHESISSGQIDIYPEYTGGMVMAYLGEEIQPGTSSEETYRIAKEGYAEKFNLVVMESMGFNNTYANAVSKDFAQKHSITTNSELAEITSELRYGAEHAFYSDRLDGYDNMCKIYGYDFKEALKIDVGLKYTSINQGEIDVVNVYKTDGLLNEYDLVVLKDDLNFFPAYYCCPVIRKETLEKYPEIQEVLSVLTNCCTEEDIIYYNYLVDSKKMTIKNAAKEFIVKFL